MQKIVRGRSTRRQAELQALQVRLQSREQSGLQIGLQSRAAGAHGGTGTPRS